MPPCVSNLTNSLLELEDPHLLHITNQTSLQSLLFDSLLCLFTDLCSRETWLQTFDFLFCFSEFPELLFLLIPAFIILLKEDLFAFAGKHKLQLSPRHSKTASPEGERDAEDEQLESLTRQINLATQLHSLRQKSDFTQSLASFTDSFLAKIRLLSGAKITRKLHQMLRRCYSHSLLEFEFQAPSQRPSTDLHYPIFNFTSNLII